jgi:hypothetical protein
MKKFIFLIVAISAFTSCKKTEYIGEWKSLKRQYPYGALLKINSDNTFTFEGGSCGDSFSSKGKWKISNDTLVLNSIENENSRCGSEFGDNCIEVRFKSDKDSIETVIQDSDNMDFCDHIIFKSVKLYVENDTLKHKRKINICPVKDYFTRNQK